MKICTVIGARPQFVKAAVVSRAIAAHNNACRNQAGIITEIIIHTGQHYDYNMSQVFFDELEIPSPQYNLEIGSGSHGTMTGKMLAGIEDALINEQPDFVLVYGDTNSTLAGALAAVKLHMPIAHVEAGLRSFNRRMPEEINRVLTDHAADILFCPTQNAVGNLLQEGISENVENVGDVMFDAVEFYKDKAIRPNFGHPFVLASLHRADNTDDLDRLRSILASFDRFPVPVILPLHPRTRKVLEDGRIALGGNIVTNEPLSYFSMLGHLYECLFVVTDSGGLQKEAYFFSKKCITVRDQTEWVELVECGANKVVGSDETDICKAVEWAISPFCAPKNIYGQGVAGQNIVHHLVHIKNNCL